jgi:hypothetical protein
MPEDDILHSLCRENVKSYIFILDYIYINCNYMYAYPCSWSCYDWARVMPNAVCICSTNCRLLRTWSCLLYHVQNVAVYWLNSVPFCWLREDRSQPPQALRTLMGPLWAPDSVRTLLRTMPVKQNSEPFRLWYSWYPYNLIGHNRSWTLTKYKAEWFSSYYRCSDQESQFVFRDSRVRGFALSFALLSILLDFW